MTTKIYFFDVKNVKKCRNFEKMQNFEKNVIFWPKKTSKIYTSWLPVGNCKFLGQKPVKIFTQKIVDFWQFFRSKNIFYLGKNFQILDNFEFYQKWLESCFKKCQKLRSILVIFTRKFFWPKKTSGHARKMSFSLGFHQKKFLRPKKGQKSRIFFVRRKPGKNRKILLKFCGARTNYLVYWFF